MSLVLALAALAAPATPSVTAAEPMAPPEWALLERYLMREMHRNAVRYVQRYTRPDGTMIWRSNWRGMEGSDDVYESFYNFPLLYALGGDPELDRLARRQYEGITRQFTASGQIAREWYKHYDWMHHGEGSHLLYYLALANPRDPKYRDRAVRYAAMYMGEDPRAPNWDPANKIIRSPLNGSLGPHFTMTIEDWAEHRYTLARYPLPFEDVPGVDSSAAWRDDAKLQKLLEVMNRRMMHADVPLNLMATSLATHAYMLTGEEKYRRWAVDYTRAWIERTRANRGIMPDNVGPSGKIGETMEGKWYGGYYGWRWPHGVMNIFDSTIVAGGNALLLTGDTSFLWLPRSQQDLIRGLAVAREGATLFPHRHGDAGWYDYRAPEPKYFAHLWNLSWDAQDWQRLLTLPGSEGWRAVRPGKDKWDGGHEGPWIRFLQGQNPGYPAEILRVNLAETQRRMARIEADDSDPATQDVEHWLSMNPVVTEGLVQLMLGGPNVLFHGGLLRAPLRYFDPARRRPGLPEDVAALVEEIRLYDDRITLVLVNLDQGSPREVLIRAGLHGEHRFARATLLPGDRSIPVRDKHLLVRLRPGAGARLHLYLERYVNRPSYAFPWP